MAEGGKEKYLIVVALIGAIATITVPVLNYFLTNKPNQQVNANPNLTPNSIPATGSQPQSKKDEPEVLSPSRVYPGDVKASLPPISVPSTQLDSQIAQARQYLHVSLLPESLKRFQQISKQDLSNPKWHSCIASLMITTGQFDQAEIEFRAASENGDMKSIGLAESVERYKSKLEYAYAFAGGHATDPYWAYDSFSSLVTANIPGTHGFIENIRETIGAEANDGSLPKGEQDRWDAKYKYATSHPTDDSTGWLDCFQ